MGVCSSRLAGRLVSANTSWCGLQGKLIAGINSRVQLYGWQLQKDSSRGLVAGAGQSGLVLALYLACRGDFIVVGKLHAQLVHIISVNEKTTVNPGVAAQQT